MSKTKTLALTVAALNAATAEARKHGDPGQKQGDICLSGPVRTKVVKAAIEALSDNERKKLVESSNEEVHQWIAGVLKHAGCLLATVDEYINICKEKGVIDTHPPAVLSPTTVRKHVEALDKAAAKEAAKAAKEAEKKESKPKPPKKAKAKTPPTKTE